MVVYGKRIAEYLLQKHANKIQKIYLAKEIDKKLFGAFSRLSVPLVRVDCKKAQALARGGNHQGILLEINEITPLKFSEIKQLNFVLVLCGISDVGNLGAIFRSAYVLGVGGIVICGISNLKQEGVIRSSAGAFFDMPFCLNFNVLNVINELKFAGFRLYGSALNGVKAADFKHNKIALFMGEEGEGLGARVLKAMDENLTISHKREFDSLNVSVASAILIDRILNGRA